MLKKIRQGTWIGLAAAAAALLLDAAGWLEWVERPSWDIRTRLFTAPSAATDQVRLILLDQDSLDWAEETNHVAWPWPREVYGALLAFCRRSGARAVGFDLIFSEAARYEGDDEAFGAAIAETPGFVAAVMPGRKQGKHTAWPAHVPTPDSGSGLAETLPPALRDTLSLPRATFPVDAVATNAALLAGVFAEPDRDSVIRSLAPVRLFDGRPLPALGLGVYLAAATNAAVSFRNDAFRIDGIAVPVLDDGSALLRFRGPSQTHRAVNAAAVIESELRIREGRDPTVPLEFFRNRYVLFGLTAPALFDLQAAPVAAVYPGVEIHATFLDNLLTGDFVWPLPWPFTAAAALALALAAAVPGRFCARGWQITALALLVATVPCVLAPAAYVHGTWLRFAPLVTTAVLALIGVVAVNYTLEGRQRRFIRSAFSQYLSAHVIDELVREPGRLRLGGQARELTIYFSDVQGFTAISEALAPEELTDLLNDYLTAMSDIVLDTGGTIDKFEGDAIIAFWNAPVDQPDHAARAVQCALRCHDELTRLRPVLLETYGRELHARIGINTGRVVVGNMGSRRRFDYTFLGDAGNLASRLEGINKQFGTRILVSEFTRRQLPPELRTREVSRVQVVGRAEPVRVFEPCTQRTYAARSAVFESFAAALQEYYAGRFDAACAAFEEIAGDDPPAAAYAERCRGLAADPPEEWDGVWVMTEK